MKKIFDVHAAKPGRPYNAPTVDISLPEALYELLDVQERLRAANASEVKVQITYSHTSKYLNLLPIEHGGLYEVNALAEKMSSLEDWQQEAFDGLVKADAFKSDKPAPISRLIDFAYSSECCHVLGGITTHKELGEFLVDNEMWNDTAEMSEEVLSRMDYTAIGREAQLTQGGVFTDNSYVEQHSELIEAHKTIDYTPRIPDYTMLLKVSTSDYDGEKSAPLKLPATSETLNKVLEQIGAGSWQETSFECLDCKAPMLKNLISSDTEIAEVNRLAETLSQMPQKQLIEYKAILAAVKPNHFDSAVQLMDQMDEYLVTPQYETLEDVARDDLNLIVDPRSAEVMIPYLDLKGYGAALVKGLNAELTDYGMVERKERQPVHIPEEQPQQGGMEMMW